MLLLHDNAVKRIAGSARLPGLREPPTATACVRAASLQQVAGERGQRRSQVSKRITLLVPSQNGAATVALACCT